jgi:hypothetical protein
MFFKPIITAILSLLIGMIDVPVSSAQSYRDLGNLSLNETFEKLLESARLNHFEELEKSIQVLTPLIKMLESKYSNKENSLLQTAVLQQNREKALVAIQKLIYFDMKDQLLNGIDLVSTSKDRAITRFKYAYLDYLLISPYLQTVNFNGEQKIRNLFRKFAISVNRPDQLTLLNQEINKELLNTFPMLK